MPRFISSQDLIAPEGEKEEDLLLPLSIVNNKWHMPRLNLNDPVFYPKAENPKPFTDEVAYKTCLGNCCGIEGMKAACCQLNPETLEHVLGPVEEKWIKEFIQITKSTNGILLTRADVVIDFEEGKEIGKQFFNNHPVFNDPAAYPIMRMQTLGPRFACKFLNPQTFKCSIYLLRPNFCKSYLCSFVKANFLVRKPGTQNKFIKAVG
jgi:Fe-S-cluster containining protein